MVGGDLTLVHSVCGVKNGAAEGALGGAGRPVGRRGSVVEERCWLDPRCWKVVRFRHALKAASRGLQRNG